ncbi:uncharacterized protein LOC126839149 [Adelges cooleyi]|uniref:uncharacterized protein LOC126839149 n=1 Tax=Adelges cooleyi TaxID=133065 RepID=UPI0021809954|nr:uncharacterized protein LOC126839149 [Adelges cooleyi]
MTFGGGVFAVTLALLVFNLNNNNDHCCLATGAGEVDQFQCTCGHNIQTHLQRVLGKLTLCRQNCRWTVQSIDGYGTLTQRMLFVAYHRAGGTAAWLWQLAVYANTAERMATGGSADLDVKAMTRIMANGARYVLTELGGFLRRCHKQKLVPVVRWPQVAFEKYILEHVNDVKSGNGTGAVKDENEFGLRGLYLNDLGGKGKDEVLKEILNGDVGVAWTLMGDALTLLYNAARIKWVYGTRELVLYQKKTISAVAASMMSYVLTHVVYCQEYWSVYLQKGVAAANENLLGDYQRMWMSVGDLLDKFDAYLVLRTEKYYQRLVDIVHNPVMDIGGFQTVANDIKTSIDDLSGGLFYLDRVKAKCLSNEPEKTFVETIALIDNNISLAEKYLKTVQNAFAGVNFNVIKDFMSSTHVWLT